MIRQSIPPIRNPAMAGTVMIALAVVAGVGVAFAPTPTIGIALLGIVAVVFFARVETANVHIWAMVCYALLIAMPALLPRAAADGVSAAISGELDRRALAQLALVAAVFAAGCLLWLVSPAGMRVLFQQPLRLLVIYVVIIAVSLVYVPNLAWSAYGLFKLLALFPLLAVLTATVGTSAGLKRVIDIMLGGITLVLALYWLDVARGAAFVAAGRIEVAWLGPNHLTLMAMTLTTVMTVRFLLASDRGSGTPRTVALALLGACTAFAAGSKASLGASAIALLVAVAIVTLRRLDGAVVGRLVAVAMAITLTLAWFIVNDSGIVAHIGVYGSNQYIDPINLTGRVPVWDAAIDQTLASARSTSVGHGYLSTFSSGLPGEFWVAEQAHNSFIQTFHDLGLVGVIVVVAIYVQVWIRVLRDVLTLKSSDVRWARAMELLALLTMLTIVSLVEDVLGGVVESRTMIFLLVLFCIYQNRATRVESPVDRGRNMGGQPSRAYSPGP